MSTVTDTQSKITSHYAVENLEDVLLNAFAADGTDAASLDHEALGRIDGFHIRGRASTIELAELVGDQPPETRVIDVGCGLGGAARVLARRWGCSATGVDLTEEYCQVARNFSARLGLDGSTQFVCSNATDLPFHDETFDVGWTEHAQMNIPDKRSFYSELRRVVRPGGQIAFHDIFSTRGETSDFPVPWAQTAEMSSLATIDDLQSLLSELDLEVEEWIDSTDSAVEWMSGMLNTIAESGPPPVGLHLLMGPTAGTKITNLRNALADGKLCVVQAVLRRT